KIDGGRQSIGECRRPVDSSQLVGGKIPHLYTVKKHRHVHYNTATSCTVDVGSKDFDPMPPCRERACQTMNSKDRAPVPYGGIVVWNNMQDPHLRATRFFI